MDPEAAAVVTPYLLVGETILWCERPRDTSALRWRAIVIGLVGISALVMRSLPLDSPLADRAATNSLLLALLFGFLLAEAIIFHSHLARTCYAVTNQRVIIVAGLGAPEVSAVFLDLLNTRLLTLHRHIGFIELRAPSDQPFSYRYPIPFTNPSVPPDWAAQAGSYYLVGLENSSRVRDVILEAARTLK
jgi:hypothetical protein